MWSSGSVVKKKRREKDFHFFFVCPFFSAEPTDPDFAMSTPVPPAVVDEDVPFQGVLRSGNPRDRDGFHSPNSRRASYPEEPGMEYMMRNAYEMCPLYDDRISRRWLFCVHGVMPEHMERLELLATAKCVKALTVRYNERQPRSAFTGGAYVEGVVEFDEKRECGRLSWVFKGVTVKTKVCRRHMKTVTALLTQAFGLRRQGSYWQRYELGALVAEGRAPLIAPRVEQQGVEGVYHCSVS